MTEDEARSWIVEQFGHEAAERVGQFLAMVTLENDQQNLIAPSTIATIWNRHALDSAQLVKLAGDMPGAWCDIGTGGGFPGIVVGILRPEPLLLVEPRRKRAEFLEHVVRQLGLSHVELTQRAIERVEQTFAVLAARAVGSVEKLLRLARQCATPTSRWILPRGRLDESTIGWLDERGAMFHVEQSLSDPASSILLIEGRP